ncbi:hypothetical protein Pmani_010848 [Petrolisthes manimaculis]|uniref:Uncharacterized protein n=1 Tax=Petrolisthes manimaculis TaxID=1843537 RepID=A0AAE1Q466_9EUCA|nr:hypothetical protein Pmani_010848 [Petrolisthes manimaculis]
MRIGKREGHRMEMRVIRTVEKQCGVSFVSPRGLRPPVTKLPTLLPLPPTQPLAAACHLWKYTSPLLVLPPQKGLHPYLSLSVIYSPIHPCICCRLLPT